MRQIHTPTRLPVCRLPLPRGVARAVLALSVVGAVLGQSTAAPATHNADDHSPNMSLAASLRTGDGGDLAFWRDTAVLAKGAVDGDLENDGFTLVDISEPTDPRIISRFDCTASAFDVSIWRDLVFLSVNDPVDGTGCDDPPARDDEGFQGIRVISIADKQRPVQLAAVATNGEGGSHTHTLLPELDHRDDQGRPDPRLLVYANGLKPQGIIEVPLRDPGSAKLVREFDTPPNLGCHDISFFIPRQLAACNGIQPDTQIWDVSNPLEPRLLSRIVNPAIEHHHSSAFSWDGNTLVIVEENLSNLATEDCHAGTPSPKGAMWFYDVSNPQAPLLKGYFQAEQEAPDTYCTVHQFNVVPLASDRDILVTSWEAAGTTVVDFTDPSAPVQLGHYIAEPDDPERRSFPWSSYWYNGFIYANNMVAVEGPVTAGSHRGTLDILTIDAPALENHIPLESFNFGTQGCFGGKASRQVCQHEATSARAHTLSAR